MRCDNCGSADARVLRVTRTYGTGPETLLIENVPLVSCSACGESYMSAETLHAINGLRSRRQLAESRTVSVVSFDAA
jgi:YgiT-type zinc finger domain-containing protein